MARRAMNVFAFLDGDDEDTAVLASRAAAKAEAEKLAEEKRLAEVERQKQLQQELVWRNRNRNLIQDEDEDKDQEQEQDQRSRVLDNGRGNWQGREYHGRGPRRNGQAGGELADNNQSNGYQANHGAPNGYRRNYGRNNGYEGDYRGNGYQGNHRGENRYQGNYRRNNHHGEDNGNGYHENYVEHDVSVNGHNVTFDGERRVVQVDGYQSGEGRPPYYRRNNGGDFAGGIRMGQGRRGRRRGPRRGSNQGYYRSKSRDVVANEQPATEGQDERQTGEHDGGKDAGDQVSKNVETKEVQADHAAGSDVGSVANGASKETKPKQKKLDGYVRKLWSEMTEEERRAIRAKRDEERAIEIEEDEKLKTLEQFEKICLEKKKALLEVSKTQERKVILDKELASMQLIQKKKEDVTLIEPQSEKDQLKKQNSHGKEEKAVKSINIHELFQSSGGRKSGYQRFESRGGPNQGSEGRNFDRRGGQNEGSEGRNFDRRYGPKPRTSGKEQEQKATPPPPPVVELKDESQFPVLCGSAK